MTRSIAVSISKHFVLATVASATLAACGGGGSAADGTIASGTSSTANAMQTSTASILSVSSISSILGLIPNKSANAPVGTTSTIVVSAVGSPAGGTGPIMAIFVDGRLIGSTEVTGTTLKNYTFTAPGITAAAKVDVDFTNDAFVNGEDRNLYVPNITVNGTTYASTDSGTTYDLGVDAAAFDGINVKPGQTEMYWGGALRFSIRAPAQSLVTTSPPGYYVDQANGDDSGAGTFASPWKSLAKLTSIKMASGDGIYLKCGSIWHEPLSLDGTQLVDGAIIAGYGDCSTNKATLSGAVSLMGGWTKSGNIWSRAVPAGTAKIARLYVDDQPYRTARWPNFTTYAADLSVAASTSPASYTVIQADANARAALQGIDVVGATLKVRTLPWQFETRTVASYATDGSITVNSVMQNPMTKGEGFILQDKLALLDVPGEFYHDTVGNRLYVYPKSTAEQADMNSAGVEATSRNQTLRLMAGRNLVVRDLQFTMSTADGLVAWNTPGIKISNIVASRNIASGVMVAIFDANIVTNARSAVSNSTFYENWNFGVDARYMPLFDTQNNLIVDTGTVDNTGNSEAAISLGDGGTATGNTIQTAAFHGINFSGGGASVVSNNYLSGYCARLTDCGGIYTWNGTKSTINQSSTVQANQLLPVTPNTNGAANGSNALVAGIYLDDFTRGVTVKGNYVSGVPIGIFLHNVSTSAVMQNSIWFSSLSGVNAAMDQVDADYMTGNVFSENEIVRPVTATGNYPGLPNITAAHAIDFSNAVAGMNSISSGSNVFRANRHVELTGLTEHVAGVAASTGLLDMNAASWRALNPAEGPLVTPALYATSAMVMGPELVAGGDFSNGLGGWLVYFGSTGGSAQFVASLAGCTGGCMQLTPATRGDEFFSAPFSMTPGIPHVYTYTAVYGGNGRAGDPYISRAGTPWDQMQDGSGFVTLSNVTGAAGTSSTYQAYFIPKSKDPAQVNLQVWTMGVPVAFDNVSVKAITGFNFSTQTDWAQSANAPRNAALTVDCALLGWSAGCSATDTNGVAITLPYTLPAGTSKLFLRGDSAWRR